MVGSQNGTTDGSVSHLFIADASDDFESGSPSVSIYKVMIRLCPGSQEMTLFLPASPMIKLTK